MYELFEEDSNIEFDHYLCLQLGFGSVVRMHKSLSNKEYMMWRMYYQREAQRKELAKLKAGA